MGKPLSSVAISRKSVIVCLVSMQMLLRVGLGGERMSAKAVEEGHAKYCGSELARDEGVSVDI